MKLKVIQVLNAIKPLKKLNAPELPIAISMKLIDIVDKLDPVLEAFEARRKPLYDSYAVVVPATKNKKSKKEIPKDRLSEFNAKINEFLDEEIEVSIEPLPLSDLKGVLISSSELRLIKWLVVEAPVKEE